MRRPIFGSLLLICLCGPLGAAEEIAVPSGQKVTFVEMIYNATGPEGLTYRFRFVAPAIAREGGTIDAEAALEDMAYLCENYALPKIAGSGPQPEQIVISLADRPIAFGATDAEVTQFFEAFRPMGAGCEWQGF